MWCELPTRFIRYTSVMRFSLPRVPLLASSDCDLGTFKCTTEFLSHIFLCNCTMTLGIITCSWVFTCPFGVIIAWLRLFYWHITHIPTWWSMVTLTFRTNEDNKPCCLQLSYDTPCPRQQCSHILLTIMSKKTTITMLRLCHRGRTQKLNLYETFDLTSASYNTSQRPFTQACSKGCIRNLESFWW